GRLVYFGPVRDLCAHFSTPDRSITRPIEIFDLLEPERSSMEDRDRLAQFHAERYRQSRLHDHFVVQRTGKAAPGHAPIELNSPKPAAPVQAKKQRKLRWKNVSDAA